MSEFDMLHLGRRTVLGVASAAASVNALAQATAPKRNRAADETPIDVRDFGARGDRQHDDGPAIAAAIAAAGKHDQYPASVFIPAGHYHRRATIALRNHLSMFGEGASSVLNSQGDTTFSSPILTNDHPDGLIHARLSELSLLGGSHGLKLTATAENADLRLTNVGMDMQTEANIEADKLFQTVKIANCSFSRAPYGLKVNGYGTNLLVSLASEWTDHKESTIYLRGTETIMFIGNRFEGGGTRAKTCLDIEDANTVSFIGCWFEDVHETLARFRKIKGQVLFQSCHFTGTKLGSKTWEGFKWDVADTCVTFRDCLSVTPMLVDGHVALDGSTGIRSTKGIIQGSDCAGTLTALPRLIAESEISVLELSPSNSAAWAVMGQLTLVTLAKDGSVRWRKTINDLGLQSRATRRNLLDTTDLQIISTPNGDKTAIAVRSPAFSRGDQLWWRFDWVTLNGGVVVRTP